MTHPLRIRTVCRDIVELCFSVVNESALPSPFIYVNYYSITGSIAGWFRLFTLIQSFDLLA
jgi:hypothetical protein